MSWLVWRQHRWDSLSTAAIVVFFGGGLILLIVVTASSLAAIASACTNPNQPPLLTGSCANLATQYHDTYGYYQTFFDIASFALPVLAGVFVGAPLISREFESGTQLLVWTQGITRRRWFVSKVGLVVLGTILASALLAAPYQLWLADNAAIRNIWYEYDARPPVLIAYTLFALALGIGLGALIQRMLPAVAATLVIFTAIRIFIAQIARPNFLPPLTWDVGLDFGPSNQSLQIGGQQMIDLAGHPVGMTRWNEIFSQCSLVLRDNQTGAALHSCLTDHGVRLIELYQPESRFWLFQSIEAAIFVALAGAFLVLAYKMVMRKN